MQVKRSGFTLLLVVGSMGMIMTLLWYLWQKQEIMTILMHHRQISSCYVKLLRTGVNHAAQLCGKEVLCDTLYRCNRIIDGLACSYEYRLVQHTRIPNTYFLMVTVQLQAEEKQQVTCLLEQRGDYVVVSYVTFGSHVRHGVCSSP